MNHSLLKSHSLGGAIGGAFIGSLFGGSLTSALPGIALFGAVGIGLGLGENEFICWKERARTRRRAEKMDVDLEVLGRSHYDPKFN